MRYVAPAGEFVPGLPACDLTDEEWAALPDDLRALALALALYRADEAAETTPILTTRRLRAPKEKTE